MSFASFPNANKLLMGVYDSFTMGRLLSCSVDPSEVSEIVSVIEATDDVGDVGGGRRAFEITDIIFNVTELGRPSSYNKILSFCGK